MGFVIGTAGHIDHVKTALVRALTGQDTDQLQAEKERGISIDLGFAHLVLPDDTRVGVVDVPGHERFIRNMVAGAHGLDLVLFVIAADDGVMPQSEEHFAILLSLGVRQAIFVITKTDRADDQRISDVREEIELLVAGSRFQNAQSIPVSNTTGAGIETLRNAIAQHLSVQRELPESGPFRLPIDRVVTVQGRGVVVTGTAISGVIATGQELVCVPSGKLFGVRGLQSHGEATDQGRSGDRLAINFRGANTSDFQRGDVVCENAIAFSSRRFDARLDLSAHALTKFKNGQRVRLHLGTAERFGTVLVLNHLSESRIFTQITISHPLHIMAGDHFILRDEQAEHTIGGGVVLDPDPAKFKRADRTRVAMLTALETGEVADAMDLLLSAIIPLGIAEEALIYRLNMRRPDLRQLVTKDSRMMRLETGSTSWISSHSRIAALLASIKTALTQYHSEQPLISGIAVDQLRLLHAPDTDVDLFLALIERAIVGGHFKRDGAYLALPDHVTALSDDQKAQADILLDKLQSHPFAPPKIDLQDPAISYLLTYLEGQGTITRVGQNMVFASTAHRAADQKLEVHFSENDHITVAEFRDLLGTTRKFALALLESFDRAGRTVRIGGIRKRGKPPLG